MSHIDTIIVHINEIAHGGCAQCWFKIPVCLLMGAFSFFFGISNGSIVLMLIALLIFDLIMGIAAAYVTGQAIESRKVLKSATKLTVYGVFISAAYLTEQIVPGGTFLDEAMISFLALTELISIMENGGRMGFTVPQKLLNQLRDLKSAR